MGLLDPNDNEAWAGALRDALDVADALFWDRIQRGTWIEPEQARLAIAAHKRIEQAKEALADIEEIHRSIRPAPDPKSLQRPGARA